MHSYVPQWWWQSPTGPCTMGGKAKPETGGAALARCVAGKASMRQVGSVMEWCVSH
jgi:hypothetical protein